MIEIFHILLKVGISEREAFNMIKDLENGLIIELWRPNLVQRELLLQIEGPYRITEHENSIEIQKVGKM